MLVSFVVFGVLLYFLVARPTVIAKQFVAAEERGDYEAAEALSTADPNFLTYSISKLPQPVTAVVELAPRTWRDVIHRRRVITVGVASTEKVPRKDFHRGRSFQVVAGMFGIKPVSDSNFYIDGAENNLPKRLRGIVQASSNIRLP
jgi:hypothetical protein